MQSASDSSIGLPMSSTSAFLIVVVLDAGGREQQFHECKSLQVPSDTTSTLPSTTLNAVWSSTA